MRTGFVIGAVSLALLGTAGLELYREVAPFFLSGLSTTQKYASLAADIVRPGQSLVSKNIYLDDCLDVSRSVYGRTQPSKTRQLLLATCRGTAAAIVLQMPTHAGAWLVSASLAEDAGDIAAVNRGLTESRQMSPNVHWLAEERTLIAERNYQALDETNRTGNAADLATLALSSRGVEALARLYQSYPAARDRLVSAVSGAPPDRQQDFLELVKAAALAQVPR